MLDQAQKMRANWQSGKSGGSQNDCLYEKKQTDKELHAFVQRMVGNAVNQQEKKLKARMVHLAAKMPSKNNDDDSDDENELNQIESLNINEADDNKESSSDGSNNWSSGRESYSNECNSLDQTIDVNLSIRATLVGHSSNPLKRNKLKHDHLTLSVFYEQVKERKSGMCKYYSTPAQRQFYEWRACS